jgi:hypothetical protein
VKAVCEVLQARITISLLWNYGRLCKFTSIDVILYHSGAWKS